MAEDFPSLLPAPLLSGYGYQEDSKNKLRTEMASGYTRVRQLSSVNTNNFSVSWILNSVELSIFEAWYEYKINKGASWFNSFLQVGKGYSSHLVRFVGEPSIKKSGLHFVVSGTVETLGKDILTENELDFLLDPSSFPSIVSATVGTTGTSLELVFSEAMTRGAGYMDTDFNLDGSIGGSDIGITYVSGSGTDTWTFTITTVIRKNETVDLDYLGRADGIEDSDGRDLAAVGSFAVINESEEDFSDIVFWAGFEGGITGSTYLGTENDYPANHTGQITAYVYDSGVYKKTGLKSLWVNSSNSNTAKIVFALPTPVQEAAGRVGFWVRMGIVYKDFFGLKNSEWVGSDYPVLRFSHKNQNTVFLSRGVFGGPAKLESDPYLFIGTVPSAILGTWVFYEVAWDYYSFGTKILANGQLISAASYTPIWPWTRTYDRLIIGADTSNGCINYYDNFMISTDPDRDLYALALLEASPRV